MLPLNKSTNVEFRAIMARRSTVKTVQLRAILKSGKPGAIHEYKTYGSEKTAADVIERLEKLNPGKHWIEA